MSWPWTVIWVTKPFQNRKKRISKFSLKWKMKKLSWQLKRRTRWRLKMKWQTDIAPTRLDTKGWLEIHSTSWERLKLTKFFSLSPYYEFLVIYILVFHFLYGERLTFRGGSHRIYDVDMGNITFVFFFFHFTTLFPEKPWSAVQLCMPKSSGAWAAWLGSASAAKLSWKSTCRRHRRRRRPTTKTVTASSTTTHASTTATPPSSHAGR